MRDRARATAAAASTALVGCLLVTGCGAKDEPKAEPEGPVLTTTSYARVWKSHDKQYTQAAVKAGPPSYDGKAFAGVDVGPNLDFDVTRAQKSRRTKAKALTPFTTIPKVLYAPLKSEHFALGLVSYSDARKDRWLSSMVRVSEAWKEEMSISLRRGTRVPAPRSPGKESTATPADVRRVTAVADAVSDAWASGGKPSGVVTTGVREPGFVTSLRRFRSPKAHVDATVAVAGTYRTGPEAGDAVRVVRVRGGLLGLVSVRFRDHWVADPGVRLNDHGDQAELFGSRPYQEGRTGWVTSLAISVPDKGAARLLSANYVPLTGSASSRK
ncbi:MAG: hypothetical protein ABWX73_13870 [Marmoricola sp.]